MAIGADYLLEGSTRCHQKLSKLSLLGPALLSAGTKSFCDSHEADAYAPPLSDAAGAPSSFIIRHALAGHVHNGAVYLVDMIATTPDCLRPCFGFVWCFKDIVIHRGALHHEGCCASA